MQARAFALSRPVSALSSLNVAAQSDQLTIDKRAYLDSNDIGDAEVVIAATDSRE